MPWMNFCIRSRARSRDDREAFQRPGPRRHHRGNARRRHQSGLEIHGAIYQTPNHTFLADQLAPYPYRLVADSFSPLRDSGLGIVFLVAELPARRLVVLLFLRCQLRDAGLWRSPPARSLAIVRAA